jgi:hypothetical protein
MMYPSVSESNVKTITSFPTASSLDLDSRLFSTSFESRRSIDHNDCEVTSRRSSIKRHNGGCGRPCIQRTSGRFFPSIIESPTTSSKSMGDHRLEIVKENDNVSESPLKYISTRKSLLINALALDFDDILVRRRSSFRQSSCLSISALTLDFDDMILASDLSDDDDDIDPSTKSDKLNNRCSFARRKSRGSLHHYGYQVSGNPPSVPRRKESRESFHCGHPTARMVSSLPRRRESQEGSNHHGRRISKVAPILPRRRSTATQESTSTLMQCSTFMNDSFDEELFSDDDDVEY